MSNNSNTQRDDALLAKIMKIIIDGNFDNLPALQQTLIHDLESLNSASVELKHGRFKDLSTLLLGGWLGMDWHSDTDREALQQLMAANRCRWKLHLEQAFLTSILNTQESAA